MTVNSAEPINVADAIGSQTLQHIEKMSRFNRWMAEVILPYVGGEVLEVGCGIGNISEFLLSAGHSVVGLDLSPEYVHHACVRLGGRAPFTGYAADITGPLPAALHGREFDTVVMLNVLEHIEEEDRALSNVARLCRPGGRFVCLVPAYRLLYGTLDAHLGHCRRYDRRRLEAPITRAGFRREHCFHFNAAGIPGWWLNGRILRAKALASNQLALYERLVPLFRRLERLAAGRVGQSLIIVAVKDRTSETLSQTDTTFPAASEEARTATMRT